MPSPSVEFQREKLKNKQFSIFFIFSNFEILISDFETRMKIILLASNVWGVQDAPLGRYSRLKMKFLQAIKISILYKNFYYRRWTYINFVTYADSIYQARDLSMPRPPPTGGGGRTISFRPPPLGAGGGLIVPWGSHLAQMMRYQNMKTCVQNSLSVMLMNSSSKNV